MSKRTFNLKHYTLSIQAIKSILLISNAFVWYFFVNNTLKDIVDSLHVDYFTTVLLWSAHYGGIAFSAIAGAKLANKITDKKRFLTIWMILGSLASAALVIVDKSSVLNVFFLVLFLGISLGIGMPSCMGFFTASIRIEKRGSVGGIVLLLSGIGLFAFGIISIGNIFLQTIILTGWRLVGLSFFVFPKTSEEETKMVQAPSYKSLVGQRPFILYIVPWIMFSLISYLTIPMQTALIGESQLIFLTIVESFLGGIFSIVGGFFADRIGRKRIAILGFASLGLGYSVLGIFPQQLFGWYFYTVVDGVALGLLYVIFVVTIWGDLSHDSASDKYYALGVLPFFVSQFLQLIIGKDILAVISPSAIFSFAAFFLFMAVLPLVYAPETLPEKLMKDRDLKSYAEKALKQAQKDSGKTHKKESAKAEKESGETKESEETPEDEEARKLAEKYY